MIDFLMSNPLFLIVIVLLFMLMFVMLFLRVKSKNTKQAEEKKEDKKVDEKQPEELNEEPQKNTEQTEEPQVLTLKRKKDKKLKKTKEKPSVERIFAKQRQEAKEEKSKSKSDLKYSEEEFLKDRQFVKTSKSVSKLAKIEKQPEEVVQEETANEDKPIIQYSEKTSRSTRKILARQKHGHFDRSRRLKRCVDTNDFDDMFCSHISEDYLNFDVDSHLRKTEIITDSLYKRASQTLANSAVKILGDEEDEHEVSGQIRSNKESMKIWLEEKRRDELSKLITRDNEDNNDEDVVVRDKFDDISLDAKNLLVVDSIMNRKSLKRNKEGK